MPARLIRATSVVPPPISTIMLPAGSCHRQPNADGGRHRLFNQINVPRPRMGGAVFDGALFHLGDAARNRDDDAGFDTVAAVVPSDNRERGSGVICVRKSCPTHQRLRVKRQPGRPPIHAGAEQIREGCIVEQEADVADVVCAEIGNQSQDVIDIVFHESCAAIGGIEVR